MKDINFLTLNSSTLFSREAGSFLQGTASAGVHDTDVLSNVWNQNDHGIQFGSFKKENIHRHPGYCWISLDGES